MIKIQFKKSDVLKTSPPEDRRCETVVSFYRVLFNFIL